MGILKCLLYQISSKKNEFFCLKVINSMNDSITLVKTFRVISGCALTLFESVHWTLVGKDRCG